VRGTGENPKVAGIGFHKTGTTSLGDALEVLGFRVLGNVGNRDARIASNATRKYLPMLRHYDAVQDNPWPVLFREIDRAYPGTRFVLTVRDEAAWIRSCVNHFGRTDTAMREWIYGVGHPTGYEQLYLDRHRRHVDEVRGYFRDRPGDLLEMNICAGDGWERLCPFLQVAIPDCPFPWSKSAASRSRQRNPVFRLWDRLFPAAADGRQRRGRTAQG
jgi:hypothetical protein